MTSLRKYVYGRGKRTQALEIAKVTKGDLLVTIPGVRGLVDVEEP